MILLQLHLGECVLQTSPDRRLCATLKVFLAAVTANDKRSNLKSPPSDFCAKTCHLRRWLESSRIVFHLFSKPVSPCGAGTAVPNTAHARRLFT